MQKINGTKKNFFICKYAIKGSPDQIEKRESFFYFKKNTILISLVNFDFFFYFDFSLVCISCCKHFNEMTSRYSRYVSLVLLLI
jgi:hypothetical protein